MTAGQAQAVAELEAIAAENNTVLSVDSVTPPAGEGGSCIIEFSLRVGALPTTKDGIRFRERERFITLVPEWFPFRKPEIWVKHTRFAGYPHVQWSRYLCLYQANSEWNAADGMFGLVERLSQWIENGAKNTLDPEEGPLHPPATYPASANAARLVMVADAPCEAGLSWLGWALARPHGVVHTIQGWEEFSSDTVRSEFVRFPTVILPEALPWEFPTRGKELLEEVTKQGGDRDWFLALLTLAALSQPSEKPVVVIIGTPMRRGSDGSKRVHFSAWQLTEDTSDGLRKSVPQGWDTTKVSDLRKGIADCTLKLFELATVQWCRIYEDRPEIVVRRDTESATRAWKGKRVMLLGCGAMGSMMAEMLCRAGCSGIVLVDKDCVTPGILVRQNYRRDDIGLSKVAALKQRLIEVRPELNVETRFGDAFSLAGESEELQDIDIIIDTTAENILHQRLERGWLELSFRNAPYAAVEIDATASACMGVLLKRSSELGPWSGFREMKLQMCRMEPTRNLYERFYRSPEQPPFLPEPGCSEPTFQGSATDLAELAAGSLNRIADFFLKTNESSLGFAFERNTGNVISTAIPPQKRCSHGGLDICLAEGAITEIFANIRKNSREHERRSETGGLLWGQWDTAANVIWVTDASDAPEGSIKSPERFICGTAGTREEHTQRMKDTLDACGFVGMWHTHPSSPPMQSQVDLSGMLNMLVVQSEGRRRLLLLIVGRDGDKTVLGLYQYQRTRDRDYEQVEIAPQFIDMGEMRWI